MNPLSEEEYDEDEDMEPPSSQRDQLPHVIQYGDVVEPASQEYEEDDADDALMQNEQMSPATPKAPPRSASSD